MLLPTENVVCSTKGTNSKPEIILLHQNNIDLEILGSSIKLSLNTG